MSSIGVGPSPPFRPAVFLLQIQVSTFRPLFALLSLTVGHAFFTGSPVFLAEFPCRSLGFLFTIVRGLVFGLSVFSLVGEVHDDQGHRASIDFCQSVSPVCFFRDGWNSEVWDLLSFFLVPTRLFVLRRCPVIVV